MPTCDYHGVTGLTCPESKTSKLNAHYSVEVLLFKLSGTDRCLESSFIQIFLPEWYQLNRSECSCACSGVSITCFTVMSQLADWNLQFVFVGFIQRSHYQHEVHAQVHSRRKRHETGSDTWRSRFNCRRVFETAQSRQSPARKYCKGMTLYCG